MLQEQQYDKQSFLDRVYRKSKSDNSRESASTALTHFEKYCVKQLAKPELESIILMRERKLDVYRVLDNFITYLQSENIGANSIGTYMIWVRSYLVYVDIEISEYKFKQKVNLPKVLERKEEAINMQKVSRILQVLPLELRMLCMVIMTSLRRPNEILQFRVRDFNFDSRPTMIRVPAKIAKNRVDGITFTTNECTELILDHIRKHCLTQDGYLFPNIAENKHRVRQIDWNFRYHMKKYPDLNIKIEGTNKQNRYHIHPYTFKDVGYTIIDKKLGHNFANGMKGDKNSEYHNLTLEEKQIMYLEIEPYLMIFNADQVRKEIEHTQIGMKREIEELKEQRKEEKDVIGFVIETMKAMIKNPKGENFVVHGNSKEMRLSRKQILEMLGLEK